MKGPDSIPKPGDFADAAFELRLPHPGLVEKDFHVVRALRALQSVELDGHRLVFGGGTSLARAHRLIQRMSEDIDLRIAPSRLASGLRKRFRTQVSQALRDASFHVDDANVRVFDGGRTFRYELSYDRQCAEIASLRPAIKVEISSWKLREESVSCGISSFWAEANGQPGEIERFPCVSVTETCADKFVALTRRIGEERARGPERDGTLLRHAYDLLHIRPRVDFAALRRLVAEIMESDRATRAAGFPAYARDPIGASREAIAALRDDSAYAASFDAFVRDMVYGEKATLADCLPALERMADELTETAESLVGPRA